MQIQVQARHIRSSLSRYSTTESQYASTFFCSMAKTASCRTGLNKCSNLSCIFKYSSTGLRLRISKECLTLPSIASLSGHTPESTAILETLITASELMPQPGGHGDAAMNNFG